MPNKFQKLSAPTSSNGYRAECYFVQKSTNERQFANLGYGIARKVLLVPNADVLEAVPESFKKSMNENTSKPAPVAPTQRKQPAEEDNNFKIEHFKDVNEKLDEQRYKTQAQIKRENKREELEKKEVETSFDQYRKNKFRKKAK